jgi:hypothetical protein
MGCVADDISDRTVISRSAGETHKNPTSMLSVEMDAELNAGHCVEPESEMQFCAIAPGAAARTDKRAVLTLMPIDRCFRLLEQLPRAPLDEAIAGSRGDSDGVISKELALYDGDSWTVLSWAFSGFSSLMFRFAVLPHSSTRASEQLALLVLSTSRALGAKQKTGA